MSTKKRLALLTGAAGAIGSVTAKKLRQDGHDLILVDRTANVANLAKELSGPGFITESLQIDNTDIPAVTSACADILNRHHHVDVLVNNAGTTLREAGKKPPALSISIEDFQTILAVNLTGAFLYIRGLVPAMCENGWGRVINMSSLGGRIGSKFNGMHYSASKAGLIGMTRTLAMEVGAKGVTVNAIAPGRIATADNIKNGTDPQMIKNYIPMQRLGTPEEIAGVVAFLASDAASYITGATLDVNGGFYMG